MSLNITKIDSTLGQQVQDHLVSLGLHTPTIENGKTPKQKIAEIQDHFKSIMEIMGLDLTDDSLIETPNRVAKMFVTETFWGLDPANFPKCTAVDNTMQYDHMLIEEKITVKSFCEHHFLPIIGHATVAYIPGTKVLGLSKLNRIVEYFSRRPQIQERLTEQIFHALQFVLQTENVAVMINAGHQCVSMRGVQDVTSRTTTSKLGGDFKDNATVRQEFMTIANRAS